MGSKIMQLTTTASVRLLIAIAIASILWIAYAPPSCDIPPSYGSGMDPHESHTKTATRKDDPSKKDGWMNSGGLAYEIANAPDFDTEWILKDPTVMSFDSYSKPIRSLYSQVHWTSHGNIPLPKEIVERYNGDGKTDIIAIVGYEIDQVRVDPTTGREVSVPITWAYNHHYMAFLLGKKENGQTVSMVEVPATEALKYGSSKMAMGHMPAGADTNVWLPGSLQKNRPSLAEDGGDYSWSFFSEGNGGECRKSYHSYPKGYAQLIRNPHSFSIYPMQIDTWNRETMNSSEAVPPTSNVRDYFPRTSKISSRLLDNLAQAKYNPLLECPCTDRLPKTAGMTYKLVPRSKETSQKPKMQEKGAVSTSTTSITTIATSDDLLDNSTECFNAAKRLLPSTNVTQKVVPGTKDQEGICEAVLRSDGSLEMIWNKKNNKMAGVASVTTAESDSSDLIVGSTPTGSLMNATLVLNTSHKAADITLKGPYIDENEGERWFAIGLGANSMCIQMQADECTTGGPYAIIVLPPEKNQPSRVVERKLDYHGPGRILDQKDFDYRIVVHSNEIETEPDTGKKRRIVRLTRPLEGPTDDYYSFPSSKLETSPLKIILAKGCPGTTQFGRHCGHQSPDPVSFARVNQWHEIRRDGIKGKIGGLPFEKHCPDEPLGDLAKQGNPTCKLETYQGGLNCCVHDKFLLDANQTIPWKDQVLEYFLKVRFYYQDYIKNTNAAEVAEVNLPVEDVAKKEAPALGTHDSASSHLDLTRFYWQTEVGAGEYDIPECKTPLDPSSCVHVITSHWKIDDFGLNGHFPKDDENAGIELVYAGPHCHAPTCLSMELYNDDTGELLCRVEPIRGKGRNHQSTSSSEEAYDEAGFLAIPPCLWSHQEDDGLSAPVFLPRNTSLLSIKRANSTFPHTGEMASWQMRGIFVVDSGRRSSSSSSSKIDDRKRIAHGRLRKP